MNQAMYDQIALDVANEILKMVKETKISCLDTQLKAKIQCLIIGVLQEERKDYISHQPVAYWNPSSDYDQGAFSYARSPVYSVPLFAQPFKRDIIEGDEIEQVD